MFEKEFEFVKQLIKEVGLFLYKQENRVILSQESRDIKMQLDIEIEKRIIYALKKSFNYPLLTEESGELGNFRDDLPIWIIDPIDGTLNFSRDFPFYCISIALWKDKQPILGVVYDVISKTLYSGSIYKGAWKDEKPIRKKKRFLFHRLL